MLCLLFLQIPGLLSFHQGSIPDPHDKVKAHILDALMAFMVVL